MDRLTTNKNVSEMGMNELAHNACYSKEGLARYRDYEMDMDARDFARNLMTTLVNEDMPIDDELFDEEIIENLIYDPFSDVKGLIALFYRNLWAMADLREKLAEYEDAEEQGFLYRMPCKAKQIVYILDPNLCQRIHRPFKCEVDEFVIDGKSCFAVLNGCEHYYAMRRFKAVKIDNFGKTVFLTQEEAEKALEAMKGGGELC